MKKILLLSIALSCLFSTQSLNAQKNVSKATLLPGPIFGMFSVSQERVLFDRFTMNTTVRGIPPKSFNGVGVTTVEYEGDEYNPLGSAKLSAIGNFTEFRIYGKEKGALRGFYWGPYFHATVYQVNTPSVYGEFQDDDGVTYSADVSQFIKLSTIGAGIQIGTQKVWDNGITLDWTIIGLGFNSMVLSGGIEATNTSNNFDFRNYEEDVNKASFGLEEFFPIEKEVSATEVGLLLPRVAIPHLKMSLAIGFGY